jgi:hypothetical protein
MIRSEPVITTATVAVLLDAIVTQVLPKLEAPVHVALVSVLVAVVAVVARRFSFSENTIREAGLDPAAVERRAADPTQRRCDR